MAPVAINLAGRQRGRFRVRFMGRRFMVGFNRSTLSSERGKYLAWIRNHMPSNMWDEIINSQTSTALTFRNEFIELTKNIESSIDGLLNPEN